VTDRQPDVTAMATEHCTSKLQHTNNRLSVWSDWLLWQQKRDRKMEWNT